MSARTKVTNQQTTVTKQGDTLARARPLFQGDVTLSPVTQRSDNGARDSDTRPYGRRHHHERRPATAAKGTTWAHIAAANLIEDHAAGKTVDPVKLEAARKLVAA
jgi:hypothetical protein